MLVPQRNAPDCHRDAAMHLRIAIAALHSAHRAERGLEWSEVIMELASEAEHVMQRVIAYSKMG